MLKRIGVDVDNTVVDVGAGWFRDLMNKYPYDKSLLAKAICVNKYPYNLTELFDIPEDEDGFAYFKSSHLYSGLKPIENSVEVLRELKAKGYQLVFITRIVGNSAKSKCEWIHKHFPFADGILLAGGDWHEKEKSFVDVGYMIEDSLKQLVAMPEDVIKLHYETSYYQTGVVPPEHNFTPVRDWQAIRKYFETEGQE